MNEEILSHKPKVSGIVNHKIFHFKIKKSEQKVSSRQMRKKCKA